MRRRTSLPSLPTEEQRSANSLERGLHILQCFNSCDPCIGVDAIADRVGITKSAATKLLAALCAENFIARVEGTDQYRIQSEAILLGSSYLAGSALVRKARPVIQSFVEQHSCHAVLCVPSAEGLLAVLYVHSASDQANLLWGPGATFALETTAIGHAWLWTEEHMVQSKHLSKLRKVQGDSSGQHVAQVFKSFYDLELSGVCSLADRLRGTLTYASVLRLADGEKAILGCLTHASEDAGLPGDFKQSMRELVDRIADMLVRGRHFLSYR